MEIKIEKEKKTLSLRYAGSVRGLLHKLKINPEDVLVVREKTLLLKEEKVRDNDSIEILSVFSGG